MSRNAPQYRVQADEITSQGRRRQIPSRSGGCPDRAGLAELMTNYGRARQGFWRVAERASHRSHVATTEESRKLSRRYHPGFGLCVFSHCIRWLKDIAQAMSFIQG
jgi:hypothetical protein